jgi:hypothetical protein
MINLSHADNAHWRTIHSEAIGSAIVRHANVSPISVDYIFYFFSLRRNNIIFVGDRGLTKFQLINVETNSSKSHYLRGSIFPLPHDHSAGDFVVINDEWCDSSEKRAKITLTTYSVDENLDLSKKKTFSITTTSLIESKPIKIFPIVSQLDIKNLRYELSTNELCLRFFPNGDFITFGTRNTAVKLYCVCSAPALLLARARLLLESHFQASWPQCISDILISKKGYILYVHMLHDYCIRILEPAGLSMVEEFPVPRQDDTPADSFPPKIAFIGTCFLPGESALHESVVINVGGSLKILDLIARTWTDLELDDLLEITDIRISPDEAYLAVLSGQNYLIVYNIIMQKQYAPINLHDIEGICKPTTIGFISGNRIGVLGLNNVVCIAFEENLYEYGQSFGMGMPKQLYGTEDYRASHHRSKRCIVQ